MQQFAQKRRRGRMRIIKASTIFMLFTMVFFLFGNVSYAANDQQSIRVREINGKEEYITTEVIYNSVGYKCILEYNKDLKLDDNEAILLAKMADYEGGTDEEKEIIMKIIASRRNMDYYPDDIKSIIRQRNMFYINVELWDEMANPSDEQIEKAKKILKSNETCNYTQYILNPKQISDVCPISTDTKHLVTEHYIFY